MKLFSLALVPLLVWVGLFCYLLVVDMRVTRLEKRVREQDDA